MSGLPSAFIGWCLFVGHTEYIEADEAKNSGHGGLESANFNIPQS
ncbi:MAG TPA: hypothetical protein VN239_09240 [Nitrososphaera sp.]|nr:hypothetical protein [Nitrososphaera sp.]